MKVCSISLILIRLLATRRLGVWLLLVWASASVSSQAGQQATTDSVSDTVYVTKSGTKYHRAGCSSLHAGAIAMAHTEASKKYTPCTRCFAPAMSDSTQDSGADKAMAVSTQSVRPHQCQAITKKGTRCKRTARPGSGYCWQHGGR